MVNKDFHNSKIYNGRPIESSIWSIIFNDLERPLTWCQDRGAALPFPSLWSGWAELSIMTLWRHTICQLIRCDVGVAQSRFSDVLSSCFSDVPPVELVRAKLTEVSAYYSKLGHALYRFYPTVLTSLLARVFWNLAHCYEAKFHYYAAAGALFLVFLRTTDVVRS